MESKELETCRKLIRDSGLRATASRLAVLALLRSEDAALSHADVSEFMSTAAWDRATLYRNLDLLAEYGFVKKYRLGGNRFLYEHVHPGQRHDHLVCTVCGRVAEFVSPSIEAMQREICRAHEFDPDQHTLQIHGLCLDCKAQQKVQPAFG